MLECATNLTYIPTITWVCPARAGWRYEDDGLDLDTYYDMLTLLVPQEVDKSRILRVPISPIVRMQKVPIENPSSFVRELWYGSVAAG